MQKIWNVTKPNIELQQELAQALSISPIIAQLLINRNITTPSQAEEFLDCKQSQLHDPFLLKDMEKAVTRIRQAISRRERIMVWGDYDVDGITAVVLLLTALSDLKAEVTYYLPNRLEEGYGLNKEGIKKAHKEGISLLLAVDCGVGAASEVEDLNRLGIDTVIIDHHHPKETQPKAIAIINPQQDGCSYPYKELAAVGLAFKLAEALFSRQSKDGGLRCIENYLDLVSLGTVADVTPITGENRILVKRGLSQLRYTRRKGLAALIDVAGLSSRDVTTGHVSYILGPRINASGRLGSPDVSLKLLMTEDADEASKLACDLDRSNRERQRLEEKILDEALAKIEKEINFKYHKVIILNDDEWHPGVIGIVASRIVERFYRPTIMLSSQGEFARGSGRSIKNFHLFDALIKCREFLKECGGHKYAVGMTILKENLALFKESINKIASDILSGQDLVPTIDIDMEVSLEKLTEELINQIENLAPFGVGNPRPLFFTQSLKLRSKPQVVGKNHLKMWVWERNRTCEAIGFRMADSLTFPLQEFKLDLVYIPSLNNWDGLNTIQLEVKDIRIGY